MSKKIHLPKIIIFLVAISRSAEAMTGACYLDRSPGGCFEQSMAQEKRAKQSEELRQKLEYLMEQTDSSAYPEFCHLPDIPGNTYASQHSQSNLTDDEVQTCIAAGNVLLAQKQHDDQQAADDYNKASIWKKVTAKNGAVFEADVGHILHYDTGAAEISMYAVEGSQYNPENRHQLLFDCQGHYEILDGGIPEMLYAPPLSVAGLIQMLACTPTPKK